jgi:hypothetical protein
MKRRIPKAFDELSRLAEGLINFAWRRKTPKISSRKGAKHVLSTVEGGAKFGEKHLLCELGALAGEN